MRLERFSLLHLAAISLLGLIMLLSCTQQG